MESLSVARPTVRHPRDNPFNSANVLRLRYRLSATQRRDLLDRAQRAGGGLLLGPHGSGKTTLLEDLAADAEQAGLPTASWRLGAGDATPVSALAAWSHATPAAAVLLLDAAGCLSPWALWRWRRHLGGRVLICTAHRRHWALRDLPVLHHHEVDLPLAERCLQELLGEAWAPAWRERLHEAFHRSRGNLRDCWWQLYDVWQRERVGS